MSLLDTIKKFSKKKQEMFKVNARFKINLELEKHFFSIPTKIELLRTAILTALALIVKQILNNGYSVQETNEFLKNDNIAKSLLEFTSNDLDSDNLSQLMLACYTENEENFPYQINEDLNTSDILQTISSFNNIDNEISLIKAERIKNFINYNSKKYNNYINNLEGQLYQMSLVGVTVHTLHSVVSDRVFNFKNEIYGAKASVNSHIKSYKYMLQHIVNISKDLFTKTDYPSKYRAKYIQRLLRNTYTLIRSEYDVASGNVKRQYESILNALKQIDDMIVAMVMISSLYLINRRKLVKLSRQSLKEITLDSTCESISEPFDVSMNKVKLEVNLNCLVETDNIIVPHVPIVEKLKNISCEISQSEETIVEGEIKEDLVTIAIIKNNREKEKFNILLEKDSFVNEKTIIAKLENSDIFSPIEGHIDEFSDKQIVIRDIVDPDENYLTSQINLLNEKYERLNDIKYFLKTYQVESLYPVMLSISIVDDASTYDVASGIEKVWKAAKKDFNKIDKEYEKQIKKITGKDNVEKHSKNETLFQIKEELEKQEEIFFKHLKMLMEKAKNYSRRVKAKSNEYELFEYYTLELGALLNGIENPGKLETKFKNEINEFIRKRLIVDGYKKNKLENKINSLIKDIEKGISLGNWFKRAMNIYNVNKSLLDLKKWLIGLADKNNKLNQYEKITYVNRVVFLFELYLNISNINIKYNILNKQTTSKKETIKEGNYIVKFISDLQKEYESIPKEIKEIEKVINSLSLFTTYSITEYDGRQARLYSIPNVQTCESAEKDPYLNPKSTYGYGDIQYWLKYCAFATLASVTNPATGWSTGWIIPTAILFPVVYIPLKSIMTKFGFIVIGLSICGIYVFPWSLFVNYSTNYAIPFIDPTAILQREIQALKKEISDKIVNLKKELIKPLLEQTKREIETTKKYIKTIKYDIAENKNNTPQKYQVDKDGKFQISDIRKGVEINVNYLNEHKRWIQTDLKLKELLVTNQITLWKLQTKYSILQEAHDLGKSLKGVTSALDKTEEFVNSKLDKLTEMVANVDKIIASLPISLSPESANFGITLKNPRPIIKIADDLDDNINENPLNNIIEKFRLKSQDLLSSRYENKVSSSILNYALYKNTLSLSIPIIMKKDPFPSYELLKLTNIPWITFLYKDFVTTGAKIYGFPGFPPFSI